MPDLAAVARDNGKGCRTCHAVAVPGNTPATLAASGHGILQLQRIVSPRELFALFARLNRCESESSLEQTGDGPPRGARRVVRGGRYWNETRNMRSAYRNEDDPRNVIRNVGFRVCLSAAPEPAAERGKLRPRAGSSPAVDLRVPPRASRSGRSAFVADRTSG